MAEPDRGLYLVFQVVHIGRLRSDESIERELSAEAKAGDEAVEGGFAVDGCPGIDILDKAFLFLAREFIREEVFVTGERLHITLHRFILFEGVSGRVEVAVVKLFDKTVGGSLS